MEMEGKFDPRSSKNPWTHGHQSWLRKHVVWAIERENRSSRSTWAQDREKKVRTVQDRTGQDSLTKKSQSGNISPIWGEAPTVPIGIKICMERHLADVITCAKFQDEIFRDYNFTGGRISHFSYSLCMGLTTAALLRCLWTKH